MEIKNFRAVNHDTIKANFNVYIPQYDLYLNKMVLLMPAKGKFVSAPSEKYEKDGETKYFPYWSFGKDTNKIFQNAVMVLLKPYIDKMNATQEPEPYQEQEPQQDDLPF